MLPGLRALAVVVISLVAATCSPGPAEPPLVPVNPPAVPVPNEVVGRLVLTPDSREAFVGLKMRLHVQAFDIRGNVINSSGSTVASSNATVAGLDRSEVIKVQYPNAAPKDEVFHFISMISEGSVVIRVTLANYTDSVTLAVRRVPPALNMLVVDSFTVLEYRSPCSWDCPYLLYAPLLKLREQPEHPRRMS